MSKNPSDHREEKKQEERPKDVNKQQEEYHRRGESMGKKQRGQKFVSDEDIVKNRRTA